MRPLVLSVFVVVAAVSLAWLVPEGSDRSADGVAREHGSPANRNQGPLLAGRGVSDPHADAPSLPATPPAIEGAPVSSDAAGTQPLTLRAINIDIHAAGAVAPSAPGRSSPDPALGDTTQVPVVTRKAFLAVSDPGRIQASGTEPPWWADRRGGFGGVDSTIVSLVRDETEAQARAEETEEVAPPVTAVVGTVVNEAGEPLLGARVVVYSAFYERHLNYGHRIREVGTVTTDTEGRFDLRPISLDTVHFGGDGEVVLSVSSEGLGDIVTQRLPFIRAEVENDLGQFTLAAPTCTLQGRLLDRKGEPVPGAVVRVSGSLQPTLYDKRERMVFLRNCPTATTDDDGRYELSGFAPGQHFISIHVHIDSPWTEERTLKAGANTLDLTIRAGGSVRGVVVDETGEPLAAAIVAGGENYTHTLEDGSFWLDNVAAGPFPVMIAHHRYRSLVVPDVDAQTEDLRVALTEPLPRLNLRVVAGEEAQIIPVIRVQWTWPPGQPPNPAVPASPNWHSASGVYSIPIPERAQTAILVADPFVAQVFDLTTLEAGVHDVHFQPVAVPDAPAPPEGD